MDANCQCVDDSNNDCPAGQHRDESGNCVPDTTPPPTQTTHPGALAKKWIGQKVMTYENASGQVVVDVWFDGPYATEPQTPPNNWIHYYTFTDNGTNLGTLGDITNCKAANTGEIFLWGGPQATFSFIGADSAVGTRVKWLSVREIDSTKPLTWQGGTNVCPQNQHFDDILKICVDDTAPPPSGTLHQARMRIVWNDNLDLSDKCFGGFEE